MATLTVEFGDENTQGEAPADIGAAGITISSGDPSGHWQVADSGGRTLLSVSATGEGNLGSSYTLTLSNADTVNLTVTASARVYDDMADLEAAGESSGLAFGDSLLIRGGTYGVAFDINRSAVGEPNGTAANPSVSQVTTDNITRLDGYDFDGCNYVKVRPALGETVTFSGVTCRVRYNGGFWFQGLRFEKILTSEGTGSGGAMFYCQESPSKIIWQNCQFVGTPHATVAANTSNRHLYASPAINMKDADGGSSHIYVADNTFSDVYHSFKAISLNEPCAVFGNSTNGCYGDHVQISGVPDDFLFAWNKVVNFWKTDSGGHVDYFQCTKTSAVDGIAFIGNRLAQGTQAQHTTGAGNGILSEGDGGSTTGLTAYGNLFVLKANTIGIKLNDDTGADVRFNTCVSVEGHTSEASILGATGATDNVTGNLTGDNSLVLGASSTYSDIFVDPQTGASMSADIEDQYFLKSSYAGYSSGHGPEGASFNYAARAYSLTGADTSGEPEYDNGVGGAATPSISALTINLVSAS